MTHENDLLLRAARGERTPRTPVWLMRQAGRSDPEYRKLRERVDLPLEELFRRPELAAEISLLPRRIGVDGIVFFQDILTPLKPVGADFVFRPGPVLKTPFDPVHDADKLVPYDPSVELPFVGATLQSLRRTLRNELPVIGFAGAPLTLAFFLIEGKSPAKDAAATRGFLRRHPQVVHLLLERLTTLTMDYLRYQVECGAQIIQLFESLADRVTADEYRRFALPCHQRIFAELRGAVPTILFAREQPRVDLMADSGADVISVGRCVDIAQARLHIPDRVAVQGNVDNELLVNGTFAEIDGAVRRCIEAGEHRGHILNLSHGLLGETPFENVCRFVQTARSCVCAPPSRDSCAAREESVGGTSP